MKHTILAGVVICSVLAGACSNLSQPPDTLLFSGTFYAHGGSGSELILSRHDNLAWIKGTDGKQTTLAWVREGDSGIRVFTSDAYAFYRATRIGKVVSLARESGSLEVDGLADCYSTEASDPESEVTP